MSDREVEELSAETTSLLGQVREQSAFLDENSSADDTIAHLARSYVLQGGASEELVDRREEIEEKQAELRENILENL